MITISNLTKQFGKFVAVQDLSFTVAAHEAVALWGPNGAGKTTVIKCLLGLLAYQGSIDVQGFEARREGKAARRLLGYVPQELFFYDDMTTLEMSLFFANLKKMPAHRARAALAQIGLNGHESKQVGALSGGMKQRLALALALLAEPPILVLDEPTANLDSAAREQFLSLLGSLKAAGKTIILTSHRLEEVQSLADRVLVLQAGRLALTCAPHQLASRLGLRHQIRLVLTGHLLEPALHLLQAQGFSAHRNGTGLLVDVLPGQKAEPIAVLSQANMKVIDFEMV